MLRLRAAATPLGPHKYVHNALRCSAMKVYEIRGDSAYQRLEFTDLVEGSPEMLRIIRFDGTPKQGIWKPQRMYVSHPKLRVPDIFYMVGALIATAAAFKIVWPHFQQAGEVLPGVDESGKELYFLNITECLNALDREHTAFRLYAGGKGHDPVKYAFFSNRFSESSLFKLPETIGEIMCLERDDTFEDFKSTVEENGLKGLVFREIWDSEK